jgi:predicted MPP superfamily phosphohydrolase
VSATLADLDIRVLQNEAVPMTSANDNSLYLVGIGPLIPEEARPDAALAQMPVDAPRLVLMHNPDVFGRLPSGAAPLAIAGHTHGGQIRIPFLPRWSWMSLVRTDEVHADGWIHDYGAPGNRLYVNRGIGFSKLPIRLNCPPELTIFTLRPAEDTGR